MPTDEVQIRQLIATWIEATRRGDVDAVLGLMTDDAVFLQPGRTPMGKAAFAAQARRPAGVAPPRIDIHSEIRELRIVGDWAFLWSTLRVEIAPAGCEPVRRAGDTLTVLRREGGSWRLARDANLLAPAAPTADAARAGLTRT